MKVNVLGTEYEIEKIKETSENLEEYPLLKDCSGYTDITIKKIFILEYKKTDDTFIDLDVLYKKTLRHELVHAFLYESGLFNNSNSDWAKNEEVVDWIAIQFEKMLSAFIKVGALNSIGIDIGMGDSLSNNPISDPVNPPKVKKAKAFIESTTIQNINKEINESLKRELAKGGIIKPMSIIGGDG